MFFYQLKLEGSRIFGVKWKMIAFILLGAIGIFFAYKGIEGYKDFLKEKEFFITHERNKVNLNAASGHYGEYGFRVLYEPSPLSVFFNNSGVFENLHSRADMSETLNINRSYKGRNLLVKKGLFKDLAGMFFLLGSLFMVYMGMNSYKSEKCYFRFGNIIIRLSILNTLAVLFIFGLYHFARIFQLPLSAGDEEIFFYFSLYLLFLLSFFYGAGLLIRVLTRNKQRAYVYVFLFWFLSTAVIPEIMTVILQEKARLLPPNEKCDITTLEELMGFEHRVQKAVEGLKTREEKNMIYLEMVKDFLKKGYIKNSKIESDINYSIQQVIQEYEKVLLVYPTSFYNYLVGEISSKGYNGYMEFVNYALELRHHFVKYYLKKRYESADKTIESFFKNDEKIFYARSFLPHSFPIAIALTLFYTVILFVVSYGILKRRRTRMLDLEKPAYKFRKGNTYFVLCKNDEYRENLFRYYQANENTMGIDGVKVEEVDLGVGLAQMLTYFCKFSRVDEKNARENLRRLGIGEQELGRAFWRSRTQKEKVPDELIYKIYCAAAMAGKHEIIVVNDFLKGKSGQLERHFLDLVADLNAVGKIIVYLSCEIFLTSLPFVGDIKVDKYKSLKVDPQAVSLR